MPRYLQEDGLLKTEVDHCTWTGKVCSLYMWQSSTMRIWGRTASDTFNVVKEGKQSRFFKMKVL